MTVELEGLLEAVNDPLPRIESMAARIFVLRLDEELTWESIAALEGISPTSAERIYENACEAILVELQEP